MEKIKVVVTGGAGFIGSHLCEALASSGLYDVVSIDNYFTGSENNHVEGVRYIRGESKHIGAYVLEADIVYHLGEYSRVEQSFEDINTVFEYNATSILAVIQFCKRNHAKLVYAGSSTKFADDGDGPTQSPYAWTKSRNTDFITSYAGWYGLKHAIVYFYNVYGGREISEGRYATLIAKFTRMFKSNQKLTVVSPGNQLRNFTHISDIISGLILVGQKGHGDEFGIGNKTAYSILEVASLFGSEIEFLPERKGNRMTAEVFTSKTESLGWEAKVDLKDYIDELVYNN
jgi:UDP-glucose 4-epimerase